MLKILLITAILISANSAKDNVSLSKVLLRFQGEEYNMLLSPKQIVLTGKKRKTVKAINKGYKRAISELTREVVKRGLEFNLKIFTPYGSNLPQYTDKDTQSHELLKRMLEQQLSIRKQLFDDSESKSKTILNQTTTAENIDIEDIEDDAFDISNDNTKVANESGNLLNISPAEAFTTGYIELSELYNQEVIYLNKVLHPFKKNDKPAMKPVHSVFGMAFFPDTYGSVKTMKVYIVLCNINTEEDKSVQIIAKEVPSFKWDRNYLYISAATGKVLRQIVSGVIGEPFLYIK